MDLRGCRGIADVGVGETLMDEAGTIHESYRLQLPTATALHCTDEPRSDLLLPSASLAPHSLVVLYTHNTGVSRSVMCKHFMQNEITPFRWILFYENARINVS